MRNVNNHNRRIFLKSAGCAAVGIAAPGLVKTISASEKASRDTPSPTPVMPTIRLGDYYVSRLVLGANPVWGYSYQGKLMSKFMSRYYTDAHILKLLQDAEAAGITLWQGSYNKRLPGVWKRYKDEGGTMNLIMLHAKNERVSMRDIADLKPIAIVHHGGASDRFFVNNEFGKVHDFVKEVKDMGLLAGVSCHRPEVIRRVSEEDWENDLFMACCYQMTRSKEEWEKLIGFEPLQWVFHRDDPEQMCKVIRSVKKPVLAFKILAGGLPRTVRS